MTWRNELVDEAKTWLRTPWHHNARVKGAGVDCGQLIIACYVKAGLIEDFSAGQYSPDWMLHRSEERYLSFVLQHLDEVETPLPGDLAVWKFGRCFSHGGLVVDWPNIIHAWRPTGSVSWGSADKGSLLYIHGRVRRPVKFFSISGRLKP